MMALPKTQPRDFLTAFRECSRRKSRGIKGLLVCRLSAVDADHAHRNFANYCEDATPVTTAR